MKPIDYSDLLDYEPPRLFCGRRLAHYVVLMLLVLGLNAAFAQGGQFIVKLKGSVELSAQPTVRRLETEGQTLAELMQRNGVQATWVRAGSLGTHVMAWDSRVRASDQAANLNRLASDPAVEFAIVDRVIQSFATPNDVNFSNQWSLLSAPNTAGAKFNQVWNLTRGNASVVVAVLDTGVLYETPDLAGRLLSGYDFISDAAIANDGNGRDSNPTDSGNWIDSADTQKPAFASCSIKPSSWHGTFVAGQIAANTNNGTDVAGADWNVKVLPVRVLGKCGGNMSDVLDGMLWSAGLDVPGVPANPTPAAVINLSLGSSSTCSQFEQNVVNRVTSAGSLVVAAAGNGGGAVDSPANCTNVVAVGALDRDGSRAYYSAVGSRIDVMAPGGYYNGLVGVGNNGTTVPTTPAAVLKTGTSFAAPMVAAAAGLLKSINPALAPAQIRNLIVQNTSSFLTPQSSTCNANSGYATCNCSVGVCGAGMLNAFAAATAARASTPLANASVSTQVSSSSGYAESANGLNPVVLQGSASSAISGRSIVSYLWEQISGESLLPGNSTSPDLTLAAPTASGDLVFRLTVTDSVGVAHASYSALRVMANGDSGSAPTLLAGASGGSVVNAPSGGSTGTSQVSTSSGGGGGAVSLLGLLGMFVLLTAFKRQGRVWLASGLKV